MYTNNGLGGNGGGARRSDGDDGGSTEALLRASRTQPRRSKVPVIIASAVVVVLAGGGFMTWRAASKQNQVALDMAPQPVSDITAAAASYRPSRSYVGTLRPWIEAQVGPQFISAYVDSVLVRPGAVVKRGEVLATLDCRDASAAAKAVSHEARAIEARQAALTDEATRIEQLASSGFAAQNEAEKRLANSVAEKARLEAEKAHLTKLSLSVSDCVLRAPFDSEVSVRSEDPGAFVRPGMPIVTVVDRGTVRMSADAPESDFDALAPGTPVRVTIDSTGKSVTATITRRAPAADLDTRTVHFEIDIPDPAREIPVNTTAEVRVEVGTPTQATQIPVYAAAINGEKATLYTVQDGKARLVTAPILGEADGNLFFATDRIKPGTAVIVEGRALLHDGDKVVASGFNLEPQESARN